MNQILNIISNLSAVPYVSSKENLCANGLFSNAEKDETGNLIIHFPGNAPTEERKSILFEAHLDEVGLCVSEILENGFLKVIPCGGVLSETVAGSEFLVYGKEAIRAIGVSVPPHLTKETKKNSTKNTIFLDTGILDKQKLEKLISVGDVAVLDVAPREMKNGKITGRSLDNKSGVAALLYAFSREKKFKNDITLLFSVGEETTSRGVRGFCEKRSFDLAVILDAGFAFRNGLDETKCIVSGKGPSVSYTDTLSVAASDFVFRLAEKKNIPLQVIAEPGGTGTSATVIQTLSNGIPSVVLSIPVFSMHTQGEIVDPIDIIGTSELVVAIANADIPFGKENVKYEF